MHYMCRSRHLHSRLLYYNCDGLHMGGATIKGAAKNGGGCPSFPPVPTNVQLQLSKVSRGEEWEG